ncbi:histidine acid phosphatase, partial [Thraustotheca clavata]
MVTTRSGKSPTNATTPKKSPRKASPRAKSPKNVVSSTKNAVSPKKAAISPKKSAESLKKTAAAPVNHDDLELVHVIMLFRHGDRSPITPQVGKHLVMDDAEIKLWESKLPSQEKIESLGRIAKVVGMETHLPPPKDPRDGGEHPRGQLTQWGLDQMEEKGKKMREHYANFFKGISADDIYIRSTNVRRTIRSCQSLLHGLLPEFIPEEEEPKLHIRTANIVSLEPTFTQAEYGTMLARYKDKSIAHTLPPIPEHIGDTEDLDKQIRDVIGIDEDSHICYTSLREVLVCRNAHDVPFPNNMSKELYNRIVDYNTWEFHTLFGNPKDCHKGFNRGIREIAELIQRVIKESKHHKLTLLAVHDSTLIAFWNAFQLIIGNVFPQYSSTTVVEIYKKPSTNEFYVQVNFDGERMIPFKGQDGTMTSYSHVEKVIDEFFSSVQEDKEPPAKKQKSVTALIDGSIPVNLLASLPPDTWIRLSPAERASLMSTLPKLGGWWGFSAEDAAAENLRQLFLGVNFDFGNPLRRFRFPNAARTARINAERQIFENEMRQYTTSLTASILYHREQYLQVALTQDEVALAPRNLPPTAHQDIAEEAQNSSYFLAIRNALLSSPVALTVDQVFERLDSKWHLKIEADQVSMTPLMYLESALTFLSEPIPKGFADENIWSSPFVHQDRGTRTFSWINHSHTLMDDVRLQQLQQIFTSPFTEEDASMAPLKPMLAIAESHLTQTKPVLDKNVDDYKEPQFKLKMSEKTLNSCYFSKELYQAQDRQRYQQPTLPFMYYNPELQFQSTVGPLLPLGRFNDAALLTFVPELLPPQSVGLANITRDALARLPYRRGTRADIVHLVLLSIYLSPAASIDDVEVAVTRELDLLSNMCHP